MPGRSIRPHQLGKKTFEKLVDALRLVLEAHPDLELSLRVILDNAADGDGVVHLTDQVDAELVAMLADPRFERTARDIGRSLCDDAAARGEQPPVRGGPLLLNALIRMDGAAAEFR